MLTIVPRYATETGADVFVGGFLSRDPPPAASLQLDGVSVRRIERWRVIDGGLAEKIYWWSDELAGLPRGRRCELSLVTSDSLLSSASVEALPAELPLGDEGAGAHRPFTLWLSSCYAVRNSPRGLDRMLARVFESPRDRPHIKCLVGDQVYLDELFLFIYSALRERRLRSRFNEQYARTWTHPDFSKLLAHGANYFLPDDHEYWNNFPEPPFGLPFRRRAFWQRWLSQAQRERLLPIQAPRPIRSFTIGDSLSIFFGDMRTGRSLASGCFMTEGGIDGVPKDSGHIDVLCRWLRDLRCPGVLVTQQPILGKQGNGSDRSLSDYDQYWRRLLPALHACKQDLVILSGDVHYGAVSLATAGAPHNPHRLIQVVSSPLSLVSPLAASTAAAAPSWFPAAAPRWQGTPVEQVLSVPSYQGGKVARTEEHAMTLAFFRRRGGGIGMRVKTWLARAASQHLGPTYETTLRARSAVARAER